MLEGLQKGLIGDEAHFGSANGLVCPVRIPCFRHSAGMLAFQIITFRATSELSSHELLSFNHRRDQVPSTKMSHPPGDATVPHPSVLNHKKHSMSNPITRQRILKSLNMLRRLHPIFRTIHLEFSNSWGTHLLQSGHHRSSYRFSVIYLIMHPCPHRHSAQIYLISIQPV